MNVYFSYVKHKHGRSILSPRSFRTVGTGAPPRAMSYQSRDHCVKKTELQAFSEDAQLRSF